MLRCTFYQGGALLCIGQITGNRGGATALRFDPGNGILQGALQVTVLTKARGSHHHRCTFSGESQRYSAPYAATGAGNQCDPPL